MPYCGFCQWKMESLLCEFWYWKLWFVHVCAICTLQHFHVFMEKDLQAVMVPGCFLTLQQSLKAVPHSTPSPCWCHCHRYKGTCVPALGKCPTWVTSDPTLTNKYQNNAWKWPSVWRRIWCLLIFFAIVVWLSVQPYACLLRISSTEFSVTHSQINVLQPLTSLWHIILYDKKTFSLLSICKKNKKKSSLRYHTICFTYHARRLPACLGISRCWFLLQSCRSQVGSWRHKDQISHHPFGSRGWNYSAKNRVRKNYIMQGYL